MDIKKINEERIAKFNEAEAILDLAKEEKRDMTAEERTSYDALLDECESLLSDASRLKRAAKIKDSMEEPVKEEVRAEVRSDIEVRQPNPEGTKEYRTGWLKCVTQNTHLLTDAEKRVLSVGTDSSGGYAVPELYSDQLVRRLHEDNVMRPHITVQKASGDTLHVTNEASDYAPASVVAENAAITEDGPTLGRETILIYDYAKLISSSKRLMQDNILSLESFVLDRIGSSLGEGFEKDIVSGDGSGKPLGLFADTGISQGVTGSVSASATITLSDVLGLLKSLKPKYRQSAKFLMSDATFWMCVENLQDAAGDELMIHSKTVIDALEKKLLGYDIIISDFAVDAAPDATSIIFGDMRYVWAADHVSGVDISSSEHFEYNKNKIHYRGVSRHGSGVVLPLAFASYTHGAAV